MKINWASQERNYLNSGFTIIEVVTVMAIVAVLSALAIPQFSDFYKSFILRSASREILASLQNLKLTALKENTDTKMVITYDETDDYYYYQLFIDDDGDDVVDAGEQIRQIDLENILTLTSNFNNDVLGFNSRGLPSEGNGTITLQLNGGSSISIRINSAGNIRVN